MSAVVSTKKKAKVGTGKAKTTVKAAEPHPSISEMVTTAITTLKNRNGTSIQAIKKYISSSYKVDAEKLAPFIKRFLKSAVASGTLVQMTGRGASGSFKLVASKAPQVAKVTKKPVAKPKKAAPKSPKSVAKGKGKRLPVKAPRPKKVPSKSTKKTPKQAAKA